MLKPCKKSPCKKSLRVIDTETRYACADLKEEIKILKIDVKKSDERMRASKI
jgi:hypothetical protein